MKNFFQTLTLLLAISFGITWSATAANSPVPAQTVNSIVVLPGATTISLELNQHVNSYDLEVGHILDFTVAQDVIVNREVVIRTGAIAEGRVRSINHPTMQNPYSLIVIEVKSVTAVDGSRVNLAGNPHRVRARRIGTPAEVELITRVTARTQRDVEIML